MGRTHLLSLLHSLRHHARSSRMRPHRRTHRMHRSTHPRRDPHPTSDPHPSTDSCHRLHHMLSTRLPRTRVSRHPWLRLLLLLTTRPTHRSSRTSHLTWPWTRPAGMLSNAVWHAAGWKTIWHTLRTWTAGWCKRPAHWLHRLHRRRFCGIGCTSNLFTFRRRRVRSWKLFVLGKGKARKHQLKPFVEGKRAVHKGG